MPTAPARRFAPSSRATEEVAFKTSIRGPARRCCRPSIPMRRRTNHSNTPGFTLVEVLVALCIFAMAAVVLGASYLNVLNSYEIVSRGMQVNEDFAFARE